MVHSFCCLEPIPGYNDHGLLLLLSARSRSILGGSGLKKSLLEAVGCVGANKCLL